MVSSGYRTQMPTNGEGKSGPQAPASIAAVAIVQFIGSVILLIPAGVFFLAEFQLYRLYAQTYRALHPGVYIFYIVLPIVFALTGIITPIGLGFLQEWARKCTLFLAVVPATVYAALLILRPPSVFPGGRAGEGALLTIGGDIYFDAVAGVVCLLVPVSIWWLLLFTEQGVKAQFRSDKVIWR